MKAPKISSVSGASGAYDAGQRAYVLENETGEIAIEIEASESNPIVNLAFVVKKWNRSADANIKVNGSDAKVRQGVVRDVDGSMKLIVWIDLDATNLIKVDIS